MRIGLDLDGCVYNWDKSARRALAEHRGITDLTPSKYWDHLREQLTEEDWQWLWLDGGVTKMFAYEDHYYPGAPKAMRRLAEMGELTVITHRPKSAIPPTLKWLGHHRVHASAVHVLGSRKRKSSVQPRPQVYIDDKPSVVEDLVDRTRATVLMPVRAWNKEWLEAGYGCVTNGRVVPFTTWKEATEWVRQKTS